MQYDTHGVKKKVSSGNPSELGLRIFAKHLIKAVAKPRACLRFCVGACITGSELLKPPSGIGLQNLRNVINEPDAFY